MNVTGKNSEIFQNCQELGCNNKFSKTYCKQWGKGGKWLHSCDTLADLVHHV